MLMIIPHYWPTGEQVAGGYSLRIEAPGDIQQAYAAADDRRRACIRLEHALAAVGTVAFGIRDGHIPSDIRIDHEDLGSEIEIPDLMPDQVTTLLAGQERLTALYLERMREFMRN